MYLQKTITVAEDISHHSRSRDCVSTLNSLILGRYIQWFICFFRTYFRYTTRKSRSLCTWVGVTGSDLLHMYLLLQHHCLELVGVLPYGEKGCWNPQRTYNTGKDDCLLHDCTNPNYRTHWMLDYIRGLYKAQYWEMTHCRATNIF